MSSLASTVDGRLMYADLARRWREVAQEYDILEQLTALASR